MMNEPAKERVIASRSPVTKVVSLLLMGAALAALAILAIWDARYYPLFHSIADMGTVFVAGSVFLVVWNGRRHLDNNYYLLVAVAFLSFALLDFMHIIGNKGMGVFPQYGNLGPTFYIASRYVLGVSFLLAPLFIKRKVSTVPVFAVYLLVVVLVLLSVLHWRNFPATYIEGVGLTPFKVYSDYAVCLMLLGGLGLLLLNRRAFDARVLKIIALSLVLSIATGLAFTLYTDPFGVMNAVGHLFQIASFYLVYLAFVETALANPQNILYRALRDSEQRLQMALQVSHSFAFEWNVATDGVVRSESCAGTLGVVGEEIQHDTGQRYFRRVHSEDRERFLAILAALRPDADSYATQYRLIRGDGSVAVLEEIARGFFDADGKLCRLVGTTTDITERKRAEEALRESERQFRIMGETVPYGVWLCAPDGGVRYCSQSFLDLLNMTQEEQQRFGWTKRLVPEDVEPMMKKWLHCCATGTPWEHEHRIIDRHGMVHTVLSKGLPVRDAEGRITCWTGVNLDITDRKRAEEELIVAKRSAEQAKLAAEAASKAKDHFLAVLSHELRNPLNPVLATASMLREDPRFGPDTREHLQVICRNAELEARLIDDLLDVTRIERGKVELDRRPVELGTIVRRAAEVCLPEIQAKGLQFHIELGPLPFWVEADAARLQQVFWNLIRNAVKFTPAAGRVAVHCRHDGNGSVVAEVSDSGKGIERENLGRIFNAFEQADRSITQQFGGLGLGLTISKALVEMHGGSVTAHSEGKDRGATFTVRLPLLPAGAAIPATRPVPDIPPVTAPTRPLRILLVEDHDDTARIMRMLLKAQGHEVHSAGTVTAALRLAGDQSFDLLLSDLGLPDGSGLDLIRKLQDQGCTLPAIALSGYGQEADIRRSREAGFQAHLTKPVDLTRLAEAVADLTAPLQPARQT